MGKFKVGFIGNGAIAQKHKDAIAATDGLEVGLIVDALEPNEGLRAIVKKSDAILIASPSAYHTPQIMALTELGAKRIICEKPVGLTSCDLDDLEAWGAPRDDIEIIPVFQNRFLATVQGVKEIVRLHGPPFHVDVRVWWNRNEDYYKKRDWYNYPSQTGGAVAHQCLHFIDYPLWWGAEYWTFDYNLRTHGGNYGVDVGIFGNDYFVCLCGDVADTVRDCRGVEFPFPWQAQVSPRITFWRAVQDWYVNGVRSEALGDLPAAIRASEAALGHEMNLNPISRTVLCYDRPTVG